MVLQVLSDKAKFSFGEQVLGKRHLIKTSSTEFLLKTPKRASTKSEVAAALDLWIILYFR